MFCGDMPAIRLFDVRGLVVMAEPGYELQVKNSKKTLNKPISKLKDNGKISNNH